jgi:hypothetical protein
MFPFLRKYTNMGARVKAYPRLLAKTPQGLSSANLRKRSNSAHKRTVFSDFRCRKTQESAEFIDDERETKTICWQPKT